MKFLIASLHLILRNFTKERKKWPNEKVEHSMVGTLVRVADFCRRNVTEKFAFHFNHALVRLSERTSRICLGQ